MPKRHTSPLFYAAAAVAFALALARCTPGGQFDPSALLDNDMFDTKAKLKGQRVPLFPSGVPGATTGVPADLVKGYKPPPDADANPDAINAPPADQTAQQSARAEPTGEPRTEARSRATAKPMATSEAKSAAMPESKPKPKVAVAHPRAPVLKPPSSAPTRIDIGAKGAPAQAPLPVQQDVQTNWPAPPPTGAAQQQNAAWPAPPPTAPPQQAAQQSQSIWPSPPSAAPPAAKQSAAPSQQSGSQNSQTFDSMWPKQSANGAMSQ